MTLCISSPIRVNKTQNIKLKTGIADTRERERERIGIFPRHNSTPPLPPSRQNYSPAESRCIENISRPTFVRRSRDHKPNIVSPPCFPVKLHHPRWPPIRENASRKYAGEMLKRERLREKIHPSARIEREIRSMDPSKIPSSLPESQRSRR